MTPRWRSSPHFRITQTKLTPGTLSLNSTTLARLSKRERQKQRRQLRAIVRAEATRGLAEEPARLASLQGPAEEPEPLLEGLADDSAFRGSLFVGWLGELRLRRQTPLENPPQPSPPARPERPERSSASKALSSTKIEKDKNSLVNEIKKKLTPVKFHQGVDKVSREVKFAAERFPTEVAEVVLGAPCDPKAAHTPSSLSLSSSHQPHPAPFLSLVFPAKTQPETARAKPSENKTTRARPPPPRG